MKFVFNYEEILSRYVKIEAEDMGSAIQEIQRQIDSEEIVLDSEDFVGGKISMPLEENFLPQLQSYGEDVKNQNGLDIIIHCW